MRFQKKLGFGIRSGVGISYLTTVYDEINNPDNQFFASHIAFLLLVEFKAKYKINKKLELTASFCYNHISNGGIKQPNYGMNFPTLTFGADYHFNPIDLKPIVKENSI
ncbi:MAG: acyloxyacyl hydrolase [Chloroflexia bacterium]|nr:acyloxyacyl hydrolase [Chloroflexia bacterium]